MADRSAVCVGIARSSCGTHLLDHLAAHGTGLTAGQVAVVAFLQTDADFPWRVKTSKNIIRCVEETLIYIKETACGNRRFSDL